MAINIFAQGQQAFDHSFDRTQGFYDQATRRKAGAKLATGDRTGAAAAFGSAGMIPEARQMQADQFAVEDRAKGMADDEKAEAAKRAQLLIGAASALKQLPPAERRQALSHPIFQMAGLPPDQLANLSDEDLSDQSLDMFVGEVKSQVQVLNLGNGGVATVDPRDGTFNILREPDHRPVVIGNGAMAVDPDTQVVIGRNAKTFAPQRGGGGGRRAGGGSSVPALPPGFVMEK